MDFSRCVIVKEVGRDMELRERASKLVCLNVIGMGNKVHIKNGGSQDLRSVVRI